jgi:hypothetical protein
MISVFRAWDKTTVKLMPLVVIALGPEDVIVTADTGTPTPAVKLDPIHARQVAGRILALANEIDNESRAQFGPGQSG